MVHIIHIQLHANTIILNNDKHPAPTVDITIVNIEPSMDPAAIQLHLISLQLHSSHSSHSCLSVLDIDNCTKFSIAETEMVTILLLSTLNKVFVVFFIKFKVEQLKHNTKLTILLL